VTHRDDDALVKQTVLLGRHDKVVRVVLVVDDVLEVNASRLSQQNNVCFTSNFTLSLSRYHAELCNKNAVPRGGICG
jgi:hypothetical protein